MTWPLAISARVAVSPSGTGTPAAFITVLAMSLFIAKAEASTPECE